MGSIEAIRRKLRAVSAVVEGVGVTDHERANAEAIKKRLEQQLREAGIPAGDWTDGAFRLGRWTKEIGHSLSTTAGKEEWVDHAFRLGKAVRRGYKRWLSR